MKNKKEIITEDPWHALRRYTQARIALGRCGNSIPTRELMSFKMAHARAMDAVHLALDGIYIAGKMKEITGIDTLLLHSAAKNRGEYLTRPDLGRMLSVESVRLLQKNVQPQNYDISLVVADGLSSTAIEGNIIPLFNLLVPELKKKGYSLAPIPVIEQGRVAVADHVAELVNAQMTIVFIGERPGLKSPDSLGIYMTYEATPGTTDERRNCISNVRKNGLSYPVACSKLLYLIEESFKRKISGVDLKDEQPNRQIRNAEKNTALAASLYETKK